MNWKQIATELAELCKKHEPEKIVGGSADRQQWLDLVLHIQVNMMDHGVDDEFKRTLLS